MRIAAPPMPRSHRQPAVAIRFLLPLKIGRNRLYEDEAHLLSPPVCLSVGWWDAIWTNESRTFCQSAAGADECCSGQLRIHSDGKRNGLCFGFGCQLEWQPAHDHVRQHVSADCVDFSHRRCSSEHGDGHAEQPVFWCPSVKCSCVYRGGATQHSFLQRIIDGCRNSTVSCTHRGLERRWHRRHRCPKSEFQHPECQYGVRFARERRWYLPKPGRIRNGRSAL